MHKTTHHLPAASFKPKHVHRHLQSLGLSRDRYAIQLIAATAEQTDVLAYAAFDTNDYDTLQPTVSAGVFVFTAEHLQDGDWLTITQYLEDEAPAQATCPNHILRLLGEARTDTAQAWRARCHHFLGVAAAPRQAVRA